MNDPVEQAFALYAELAPDPPHSDTSTPDWPATHLSALHAHGRIDGRLLLENPHCPPVLICQLMAMPSPILRAAIRRHPRCPPELRTTRHPPEPTRNAA